MLLSVWAGVCVIIFTAVLLVVRTKKAPARRVWLTMTTLPERLTHVWFESTLRRTISICEALGATLLLQVPFKSQKGAEYKVPATVSALEGRSFSIQRVPTDEGPITKLLPALRDSNIGDRDVIVVCDDDIVYRQRVFALLVRSVQRHPNAVSCMCMSKPQGYAGFAFRKETLEGLRHVRIPDSCRRIDDDVIDAYIKRHRIPLKRVKYFGDSSWICSMHQDETDRHPRWDELRDDDRPQMVKRCVSDLDENGL